MQSLLQVIMAVLIFALLGSVTPDETRTRADEVKNGLFSMIAFVLGASTSILCGYLGMKIATYANARTAVEARKGIAPAFMCGECIRCSGHTCAAACWGCSCLGGCLQPSLLQLADLFPVLCTHSKGCFSSSIQSSRTRSHAPLWHCRRLLTHCVRMLC